MKKMLLPALAVGYMFFTGCEEVNPPVVPNSSTPVAFDTSYIAPVPSAQERHVVVEEFTGATCANCPAARDLLTNKVNASNGKVIPIEIHIFNFVQSQPAHDAKYDLRTQDGTDIGKNTYSKVGAMPIAGVNRKKSAGEMLLYSSEWGSAIDKDLAIAPVANLDISSTYDNATRTATVKVKIAYIQSVNRKQFLTLAVLEDNIIDIQEFGPPNARFEPAYKFMHTLRDIVTSVDGDEFLTGVGNKVPGQVYERTFIYPVPADFKPEDCKFVAFVHDNEGDTKEILQGAEAHMAP